MSLVSVSRAVILTSLLGTARADGVDPKQLEAHVRMLSETCAPRDESHPGNLDRAATYIRGQFERTPARVWEQVYEVKGRTFRNVVARFGADTGERIVVGAHYDAFEELPGADDNASGVAGLIELAQLLGHAALPRPVELVAYTLEEPPYFRTAQMGSAVHARALKKAGVRVRAMLSLEMIGYFSDAPNSQDLSSSLLKPFYPSQGNFIAVIGNLGQVSLVQKVKNAMANGSPLPVESLVAPQAMSGIDFSDHLNYWAAGYPAVMITDTAFLRNKAYHTARDTPDRLDYRRMAMVVEGVYAAVRALSE